MGREDAILIGVDGGATEVKAHAVEMSGSGAAATFALRPEATARKYPRIERFQPVPTHEQLAQRADDRVEIGTLEHEQGQAWITAAADAIAEVAQAAGSTSVTVGVGMPGLKTMDGGGIIVINNGPRIPRFSEELSDALSARGLSLAAPLPPLQSDADCCGIGEQHATEGLFRDVDHAYYVGCGTGVADALKLRGELVPFDAARDWIQKAWQMPSALGATFEQLVSARALNAVYAQLIATDEAGFPEATANDGDPIARTWLDTAALVLAELIYERIVTIKNGRTDAPQRGQAYAALQREHPYRGVTLERIIIGQRLGQVYGDERYRDVFAARLDLHLATLIAQTADAALREACLHDQDAADGRPRLKTGLLRASRLRAAPALGAAIVAGM